jgi:hypothetical protein
MYLVHSAVLGSETVAASATRSAKSPIRVPVELDLGFNARLPDSAEVAAYYVIAEARPSLPTCVEAPAP